MKYYEEDTVVTGEMYIAPADICVWKFTFSYICDDGSTHRRDVFSKGLNEQDAREKASERFRRAYKELRKGNKNIEL